MKKIVLLLTLALVLSGCAAGRLVVHCTLTNPQNCN